ncbi:carbohydrate-binding protein, partial [Paenibacillus graminis]
PTPTATVKPTATPAVTPTPTPTATPGQCTAAAWNAITIYTKGQKASYGGVLYEAQWWTQGERPDLSGTTGAWKVTGTCGNTTPGPTATVSPTATPASTATPVPTATVNPTATPSLTDWAAGVDYTAGDKVSYSGKTYICLQSHTSLLGWEPATTAALWQLN